MNTRNILQQYWGFDSFRPMQQEIIESVLQGNDTLALLPTGGGKSICYQVPALAKEGICLVVSPLVALMKDQVEGLRKKDIPALFIHSAMKYQEVLQTLKNAAYARYKFLYVSPERLQSNLFKEFLPALNINLIAVDEAHCISQWGYDFRPAYLQVADLRDAVPGVPVLALTASATKDVQEDICDRLNFTSKNIFRQSFARPNLSYSVFETESKITKLVEILTKVKGSSIVYCSSRRKTKEVADLLKLNGFNADYYHAGLKSEERNEKQDKWIRNEITTIVCTNAFGMGIDKPDVRVVVHYDSPDCLESYYQEAGRAGRDGKRSYAVLLYDLEDLKTLEQLSTIRFPSPEVIKQVYNHLMNYLQVPVSYGGGQFYDFDLNEFIKRFGLNIHEAIYSIKQLEMENLLQYNEQVLLPPTVIFTSNKDSLNEFEKAHPETEYLIKGLLRTYQGIFDIPANISEKHLTFLLQQEVDEIKKGLMKLNSYGVIQYLPVKDRPQVFLLNNRVKIEDLRLDTTSLLKRKKTFESRLNKMTGYLKERKHCRERLLAAYFDDSTVQDCGICDSCLSSKSKGFEPRQFDDIRKMIVERIRSGKLTTENLLFNFPGIAKDKVEQVINYLIAEEEVKVDENDRITEIKKG